MQTKPVIKYLTDFLDYLEIEKGLSAKTQENYTRFLQKFFKWLEANNLSSLSPAKLTADHVWKYRVFLSRHIDPHKKIGLKKSTQNYYLIALRVFLKYLMKSLPDVLFVFIGEIDKNATDLVKEIASLPNYRRYRQ